jgi:hypothetical protein
MVVEPDAEEAPVDGGAGRGGRHGDLRGGPRTVAAFSSWDARPPRGQTGAPTPQPPSRVGG